MFINPLRHNNNVWDMSKKKKNSKSTQNTNSTLKEKNYHQNIHLDYNKLSESIWI